MSDLICTAQPQQSSQIHPMLDNSCFHEQSKGLDTKFSKKNETCLASNVNYSIYSKTWEWTPLHTSRIQEISPRWQISSWITPISCRPTSSLPRKSSASFMTATIIQTIIVPVMTCWTALTYPSRRCQGSAPKQLLLPDSLDGGHQGPAR